MSVASSGPLSPPGSPEAPGADHYIIYDQYPRLNGGVLLDRLKYPKYENAVIDVQPYADPLVTDAGTTTFNAYSFDDGTVHHVAEGTPHEQRSAIPVDSHTAWWTEVEGHNHITDEGLMALGFKTRRVGSPRLPIPEGGFSLEALATVAHNLVKGWRFSLAYTASNMNKIFDVADAEDPDVMPGVSFLHGESQAAMTEPASQIDARLRAKPRVFVHADTTDACCAEPFIDLKHPISMVKRLPRLVSEGQAFGRTALSVLRGEDRAQYIGTMDLSLDNLLPNLGAAHKLLGTEPGRWAHAYPLDARKHQYLMRKSAGSDGYEVIYKDFPLVHTQMRDGAHIDIPRTRRGVLRRHGIMMDELVANGDDYHKIDFDKVYELPERERRRGRGLLRLVS